MYFNKEKVDFSKFGRSFQDRLCHIILNDRAFADQIGEVLNFDYFELKYQRKFVGIIFDFKKEYEFHPPHDVIQTILDTEFEKDGSELNKQLHEYFEKIKKQVVPQDEEPFVKDKSLDFCKKQNLKKAMAKSYQLLQNSSFDEIQKIINEALKLGIDNDFGYDFIKDFEERYQEENRVVIPTPWHEFNKITGGGLGKGELGIIISPTGCHSPGTKIIMFDGTLKKVEDVKVGDQVMGFDSKPRTVLTLYNGNDKMYKISPTKGDSFVINSQHVMPLRKAETEEVTYITFSEYIKKSKNYKRIHKLYRTGIDFEKKKLPLDPYATGLFISSGEKFIPFAYKTSSIEDRKSLLAGLIDSDGHKRRNGGYEYSSKSLQLAEDVLFLCRSLGYAAYKTEKIINGKNYWRILISGDFHDLPSKLERKKSLPCKQKKNVLNTGFKYEELEEGEYYGFMLDNEDGEPLYLLEDFTVMHNCGKSMIGVALGAGAIKQGLNVIYYTLELSERVIGKRFDSCITGHDIDDLLSYKDDIKETLKDIQGKLIIKTLIAKKATVNTIHQHIHKCSLRGFVPDMIVVDYGDLLKSSVHSSELRHNLGSIFDELRGLAQESDVAVWTMTQTNRKGLDSPIISMNEISEAYNKCFGADFVCCWARTTVDKQKDEGRFSIEKNRNGPDGIILPARMRTANVSIQVFPPTGETPEQIIKRVRGELDSFSRENLNNRYKQFQNKMK